MLSWAPWILATTLINLYKTDFYVICHICQSCGFTTSDLIKITGNFYLYTIMPSTFLMVTFNVTWTVSFSFIRKIFTAVSCRKSSTYFKMFSKWQRMSHLSIMKKIWTTIVSLYTLWNNSKTVFIRLEHSIFRIDLKWCHVTWCLWVM